MEDIVRIESPVVAIGDVHGQIDKLRRVLKDAALVDQELHWSGSRTHLWFMGDYVDRGQDSVAVLDLVMRLQREAHENGGEVHALLGNHDVTLLAACRFPDVRSTGPGGTFRTDWQRNGGDPDDLERIQPEHIAWLLSLPLMAHDDNRLFAHADSTFYDNYGVDVDGVNEGLRILLHSDDVGAWDTFLHRFGQRETFFDAATGGTDRARRFLERFGGKQFIHAHTPIDKMTGKPADTITQAFVYADGLCVNVDGGMYRGGPGFAYAVVSNEAVLL